jgi:hypothetical protein
VDSWYRRRHPVDIGTPDRDEFGYRDGFPAAIGGNRRDQDVSAARPGSATALSART